MSAPRKIARSERFLSLDAESVQHGEKNDCVVKAYALAARVPYSRALRTAAAFGRETGRGMFAAHWLAMFRETGVEVRERLPLEFIARYPGVHSSLRSVTTHHPARFPAVWEDGRRYLLVTRTHMAYVENGVLHDWTAGRAFRVEQVFEVMS